MDIYNARTVGFCTVPLFRNVGCTYDCDGYVKLSFHIWLLNKEVFALILLRISHERGKLGFVLGTLWGRFCDGDRAYSH